MKYIPVVAILFVTLFACRKNNDHQSSEGFYVSDSILQVDRPTMYTIGGSSSDAELIRAHLSRRGWESAFVFDADEEKAKFQLTVDIKDSANVIMRSTGLFIVDLNSTRWMKKIDEHSFWLLYGLGYSDPHWSQRFHRCEELGLYVSEYRRTDSCWTPDNPNFAWGCRVSNGVKVLRQGSDLQIPLMTTRTAHADYCASILENFPDQFYSGRLSELIQGDTVIVQTKRCILRKR